MINNQCCKEFWFWWDGVIFGMTYVGCSFRGVFGVALLVIPVTDFYLRST